MKNLMLRGSKTMITIEPIMDFDMDKFVKSMINSLAISVNIGADSGNNNLPEPSWEKVQSLINRLQQFTKITKKRNLDRLKTGGEK